MKRYCLLLVFLLAGVSLRAQIVGDVAVARKVLAERNGELHMVLEISVSRKAVTRSQSWMILPELSTADRRSVKLFPHILINGRYQQHMMERRQKLSGSYWAERQPHLTINVDGKTDRVFNYEMKVPWSIRSVNELNPFREDETSRMDGICGCGIVCRSLPGGMREYPQTCQEQP